MRSTSHSGTEPPSAQARSTPLDHTQPTTTYGKDALTLFLVVSRHIMFVHMKDRVANVSSEGIRIHWAFIISWTFLHNFTVYFGGYLFAVFYSKLTGSAMGSIKMWYPDYWPDSGCLVGGLCSLIFGWKLGTRDVLIMIRGIQMLGILIIICLHIMQDYYWVLNYWYYESYYKIILQGFISSMTQIVAPIYIMETICDKELRSPVTVILLISTKLPFYTSSLFAVMISKNDELLTYGGCIFVAALVFLLLSIKYLPKTSQNGIECGEDENVSYWHRQFEKQSGCLSPTISSLGICLLSQMTGFQMYERYEYWAIPNVPMPMNNEVMKGSVPFFTILLTLHFWTKNRLPVFLITTTIILTICLFLNGIILHGFEAGGYVYPLFPSIVDIISVVCYSAGLLSLTPIVCLLLIPRRYRLVIFSLVTIVSFLDRKFVRNISSILVEYLHPFGMFWLHSGVACLGLIFLIIVILDQLRDRNKSILVPLSKVEEITTEI